MTAQTLTTARTGRRLGPAAVALLRQFPPRRPESRWSGTEQSREQVLARLLAPPYVLDAPGSQARRRAGIGKILRWLEQHPGQTWQDRWLVSGADAAGNIAWRHRLIEWLRRDGTAYARAKNDFDALGSAILVLISGEVIRPSLSWLLTPGTVQILTAEVARSRDPAGFAELVSVCRTDPANSHTKNVALTRIATIMAAKGGEVRDITAGDCVEMAELLLGIGGGVDTSAYFYQLLHAMGVFPDGAPSTVRAVSGQAQGQISVEQMIDRYRIACRPVRNVLVDYLRERQPSLDFTSLRALSFGLGKLFWKDLETHHPGIDSLRLAPDVAAAWKQRIARKTTRSKNSAGQVVEVESLRSDRGINYLAMVRAFYLDLAQRAMDDPTRWGVLAAPCPIRDEEMSRKKDRSHRKSRIDQRTRERLPVLSTLAHTVDIERRLAAERLTAAQLVAPGAVFTAAGHAVAPLSHQEADRPGLGRRSPNRQSPRSQPGGTSRVLDLGRGRDIAAHRDPSRGTHRAVTSQPGATPAARQRRAHPAAAHRPLQDRRRAAAGDSLNLTRALADSLLVVRNRSGKKGFRDRWWRCCGIVCRSGRVCLRLRRG